MRTGMKHQAGARRENAKLRMVARFRPLRTQPAVDRGTANLRMIRSAFVSGSWENQLRHFRLHVLKATIQPETFWRITDAFAVPLAVLSPFRPHFSSSFPSPFSLSFHLCCLPFRPPSLETTATVVPLSYILSVMTTKRKSTKDQY